MVCCWVGFFCFVLWLVFFSWGSKKIYKVFLWGFGSISWKDDWDAKSTCGIAMAPSHSKAEAGAASAMARRKLVMEGSRSGAVWGRLCWATLIVCVPPTPSLPRCNSATPAHPCPSSWVLGLVRAPRACSMVSIYRTCSLYLEKPVPGRRSLS